MKPDIKIALLISIIAHVAIICGLVWLSSSISPETAYGEKEYIVAVELLSDAGGQTPASRHQATYSSPETPELRHSGTPEDGRQTFEEEEKERGSGSVGRGSPSNMTGDMGANKTLARIKAKIEANKRYPRLARKMNIEGKPTVLFEIGPDGSLKYVRLSEGSGKEMLDQAAIDTVMRSAPLPYYEKPIRLAIKYELQ